MEVVKQMVSNATLWDVLPNLGSEENSKAFRFSLVDAVFKDQSPKSTLEAVAPMVQAAIDNVRVYRPLQSPFSFIPFPCVLHTLLRNVPADGD